MVQMSRAMKFFCGIALVLAVFSPQMLHSVGGWLVHNDPPAIPAPKVPAPGAAVATDTTVKAKVASARTALAAIPAKGRAPKTGYTRSQFGPAWADVDRNGCDTRNDILKRDLTGETFRPGTHNCVVVSGVLADRYTGKTIAFTKAKASAVQIDHVVSLSNSWQTGSQRWTADRRKQFANDPMNLWAADGPTNGAKGDSDAATWLPPNKAFRCEYVSQQTLVKAKYGLWMTPAEKNAVGRILSGC